MSKLHFVRVSKSFRTAVFFFSSSLLHVASFSYLTKKKTPRNKQTPLGIVQDISTSMYNMSTRISTRSSSDVEILILEKSF